MTPLTGQWYEMKPINLTASEIRRLAPGAKIGEPVSLPTLPTGTLERRPWSNAVPTESGGIKFASKTEARVYDRLCEMFGAESVRCQVRMPLLAGAPKPNNRPLYMTIDFCIVESGCAKLWVDAKTKRKSREWARGKSLFEATWGRVIEYDGTGEFLGPLRQLDRQNRLIRNSGSANIST